MTEKRHVLYFCDRAIDRNPPCLTECCQLRDLGYAVTLVTISCSNLAAETLAGKGVEVFLIPATPNRSHSLKERFRNYLVYNHYWKKIRRRYWTPDSVIWYGTESSWMKQYHNTCMLRPNVVNCLEFYEDDAYQKGMKEHLSEIDVLTACEPTRAQYMKDWWHLDRLPYVLRNKPYEHPRRRDLPGSTEETRRAIAQMEGRKILLYQGAIVGDRDLSILAESLSAIHSDYTLALSGPVKDNSLEKLQKSYDKVLYLGNIPAPKHLELTSHADICVAFYKDNCINNRYCAPNKIYEYTGFGIPVLCNRIPGLTSTIGQYGAGVCTDFHDPEAVRNALDDIRSHYEMFCEGARRLYDETDNMKAMREIMDEAFAGKGQKQQ